MFSAFPRPGVFLVLSAHSGPLSHIQETCALMCLRASSSSHSHVAPRIACNNIGHNVVGHVSSHPRDTTCAIFAMYSHAKHTQHTHIATIKQKKTLSYSQKSGSSELQWNEHLPVARKQRCDAIRTTETNKKRVTLINGSKDSRE